MPYSMSVSELETGLCSIVEQEDTTIVPDSNIFKPPYMGTKLKEIDLSGLLGEILDGYYLPRMIITQRKYNRENAKAAKIIEGINAQYIGFLKNLFENNPNLTLVDQVRNELNNWLSGVKIDEYDRWKAGEEAPFSSEGLSALVRIRGKNPHFQDVFSVQFEYKRALQKLLQNVTEDDAREKVVNYDIKFKNIIEQLAEVSNNECNLEDKKIFASAILAANAQGNTNLTIISNDEGMVALADYIAQNEIADRFGINEIRVHNGYTLKLCDLTKKLVPLKFDLVYPTVKHEAT